jgi:hypothetical protein
MLKFGAPPGVLSGLEFFQSNRKHSSAKKRWKQARLGTLPVDN